MKPQIGWLIELLPAATMLGAVEACAAPITFYFEGHVNFIHDFLQLDDSVVLGVPFSGGYVFDPTGVVDDYPQNQRVGSYYFESTGRMWARIGNYEFTTTDLGILIWNNMLSGDLYEPISFSVPDTGGYQWKIMSIVLANWSGTALHSDALPTGVPELSDFPDQRNLLIYLPGNDVGIRGTLTSLTPEPGCIALVGLGATALLTQRRRR